MSSHVAPKFIDLIGAEAEDSWSTPYGTTGRAFSDRGIEVVWVVKDQEEVDPSWFSQPVVDVLIVIRGMLFVEFADPDFESRMMSPGQMLVLPENTRCRAFRWPRDARDPTVFVAVYPQHDSVQGH